jgi:hypothetical protein
VQQGQRQRRAANAERLSHCVRPEGLATLATVAGSREFDDPIPLPRGRQFVTLREAADYITRLPKAEQNLPEWQTAIRCLLGAEGHDFLMHARIGMLRALNRNVERVFNPDRKERHWGKRKLARGR